MLSRHIIVTSPRTSYVTTNIQNINAKALIFTSASALLS